MVQVFDAKSCSFKVKHQWVVWSIGSKHVRTGGIRWPWPVCFVHFNFTILTYHLWIAILCNKNSLGCPPWANWRPPFANPRGPGGRWPNRSKHHWNWWVPQPLKINCRSRDGQNWDPQKLQLVRGAGDGVVKPWFVWVGWVSCARVVLELDRF